MRESYPCIVCGYFHQILVQWLLISMNVLLLMIIMLVLLRAVLVMKSGRMFNCGMVGVVMLLKTDGCIKVMAIWVVVRVKGLPRRELFVVVLRERQISHHRCIS
jgi:hypothetical protein